MQDCLQLDLPPHPDPYSQPRPVSIYPSMPLSPPGQTVNHRLLFHLKSNMSLTSSCMSDVLLCV